MIVGGNRRGGLFSAAEPAPGMRVLLITKAEEEQRLLSGPGRDLYAAREEGL